MTTPKAPAEEKKTPASKAKKATSKKAKAAEEDSTPEVKEPEKQVDPEELRKKKEKESMYHQEPTGGEARILGEKTD